MVDIKSIDDRIIWDEFLEKVQPNTFLHSWQWGEFQQGMGERVWRLGVYTNSHEPSSPRAPRTDTNIDALTGIALIVKVRARRGNFLFCPHGPIIEGIKNYELRIKELIGYVRELAQQEKCSFVRFSPLMLKTPEHNKLWLEAGFREAPIHMHPELAWILDITPSEEKLLAGMRKTTRYSIRKAEKDGVAVTMSANPDDIEKFWAVYSATVDRQHFVPFSKPYLRAEFEVFAQQGSAALFFGIYRGEIISTAFIVFQSGSAFYHHGASIPKYTNIPASQLVQWHAILEAKRRGCKKYNFWGIAPDTAKNHPWSGLSLFKKGFGGLAEEYTHAKDLVISPAYWLNFTIEHLRRIKRHL
ncbi:peptidoglycan bridge formation glycyltransferase FemA/FemB family protein [Candidatus Uhrbacteria bacterium]|nr:peptidoglycan bridge formation glycyltransferase FemA/FemB family protein [Candidatus Uhrbacteria bacterium]